MIQTPHNLPFKISEIPKMAEKILSIDNNCRIFLFEGQMGAGKTTLIKEMCRLLESKDSLSSPTFSLVNEYETENGKIYHMDLYRLKNQQELFDIGIEEYLSSGNYCLIEWPELVENLIDDDFVKVNISIENNLRCISAIKIV